MLGRVRPTTHRGNGSASEPEVGLSDGRLALVHRYMIDAEEAEAGRGLPRRPTRRRAKAPARPRRGVRAAAETQERSAADRRHLPIRSGHPAARGEAAEWGCEETTGI